MANLASKRCVPCEGGVAPASEDEIAEYRKQVPDWKVVERDGVKRLERKFLLPDFASALELANRVGEAAEEQGHHPLLCLTWGELTVTWWTHAIGGLHENDFIMAARADRLERPEGPG
ncbi:MAG TPA: 4a-hydroxytetrahydrobiopterin dehydratase [Thermoanaerobaculia bacterium]